MTDKEKRITDILNKLNSLTLESSILANELRALRDEHTGTTSTATTNDFKEGDKVTITNFYKGKKGTKGVVTRVTKKQVTIKDEAGKTHIRKLTNIKKTE
jgi:hypothetical protein